MLPGFYVYSNTYKYSYWLQVDKMCLQVSTLNIRLATNWKKKKIQTIEEKPWQADLAKSPISHNLKWINL